MLRLQLVTVFFLVFNSIITSQFKTQNPDPQSNSLFKVFFVNENTGWAVGSLGTLMKTKDGGKNWTTQCMGFSAIRDLYFVDENIGWIVTGGDIHDSADGAILKTTDGGLTWKDQLRDLWDYSKITYPFRVFRAITFVDRNRGWATGSKWVNDTLNVAVIYKTTNGGETWNEIFSNSKRYSGITKVQFENLNTGYMLYLNNSITEIDKTTDGGVTWKKIEGGISTGSLMCFEKEGTAFLASHNNTGIVEVNENGSEWKVVWDYKKYLLSHFSGMKPVITEIKLFGNKGVASGYYVDMPKGIFYAFTLSTNDKFATVDINIFPDIFLFQIEPFNSLYSFSGTRWFITTNVYRGLSKMHSFGNNLLVSDDMCRTLNYNSKIYFEKNLTDLIFNDAVGLICGEKGTILRSENNGKTWKEETPITDKNLLSIVAFRDGSYIVGGEKGSLFKSVDKAKTWQNKSLDEKDHIYSIFFTDEKKGWLCGGYKGDSGNPTQHAVIFITTDGGSSWTEQFRETGKTLYSIYFIDENNGWAVGSKRYVYRTVDGGKTWIMQTEFGGASWQDYRNIYKVQFISKNVGFIFMNENDYKLIYKTIDGGNSWTELYNIDSYVAAWNRNIAELKDVLIIDENTMYAFGKGQYISPEHGVILKTTDGAKTWNVVKRELLYFNKAVSYNGHIWACGENGYVVNDEDFNLSLTDYETKEIVNVPTTYSLCQNYPNPFNPETVIEYTIPKSSNVEIKVYDILGREIATLVKEFKQAGKYSAKFSISGRNCSSGIYFYRISAEDFSLVKKMMLIK